MSKSNKKPAVRTVFGFIQTKDGLQVYKRAGKAGAKLKANESFRFTDVRALMVESISKQMDDLRKLRHTVYTSKEKNFSNLAKKVNG